MWTQAHFNLKKQKQKKSFFCVSGLKVEALSVKNVLLTGWRRFGGRLKNKLSVTLGPLVLKRQPVTHWIPQPPACISSLDHYRPLPATWCITPFIIIIVSRGFLFISSSRRLVGVLSTLLVLFPPHCLLPSCEYTLV